MAHLFKKLALGWLRSASPMGFKGLGVKQLPGLSVQVHVNTPINVPKWECYTLRHGEGLEKISSSEIRANTPKWESSLERTQ